MTSERSTGDGTRKAVPEAPEFYLSLLQAHLFLELLLAHQMLRVVYSQQLQS